MASNNMVKVVNKEKKSERGRATSVEAVEFGVDVRSKVVVGDLVIVSIMWVRGVMPGDGEA